MDFSIRKGLPARQQEPAARIFWEAFGGKLGTVLGPEAKALRFLTRVLRGDHCIAATDEAGRLIGIAGFKTPMGSFAGGNMDEMRAAYGPVGARWRQFALWLLAQDVDNDRFLVDGVAVTRDARGQGIGRALLAALYDEGRARGYREIRLEVIDSNWRAKALYEREGFTALHTEKLGLLRHLFGFESATTMVRVL